jgi:heat shock protein HslJ
MMMCEQAVMDQEGAYLKALEEAKTYAIKGDQLTLSGEDGTPLAVYKAQSQDLAGTNWEVTAYNNGQQAVVGVLEGTTLAVNFSEDGNLSGNAGCNQYNGAYEVNGDQITIGPLASTMKICGDPEGVMDQEAQFLAALESAASYQIEGDVLEMRTKDEALAALFKKK